MKGDSSFIAKADPKTRRGDFFYQDPHIIPPDEPGNRKQRRAKEAYRGKKKKSSD